jgi:ubiquinone biosynthesis protein UbiJ
MMTESNEPQSISSTDEKLNAILQDVAVIKSQLDRVEKRLDGIDNRLWVFMGGILTAALAALLRLIPEV